MPSDSNLVPEWPEDTSVVREMVLSPDGSTCAAIPGGQRPFKDSPPRLTAGQILGQYRIIDRLGAGGMGEVYRAVHIPMNRVVALKVMAPYLLEDPRSRARFQQEVQSAGRLAHPNIVMAHDASEDRGLFFLVMEYVDGDDLQSLLTRFGPPPIPVACEIIRQTALGLQHAFEKSMVHRDIKPANLILARSSPSGMPLTPWEQTLSVKILDFGLARLEFANDTPVNGEGVTREGTIVGTPEYLSPEQATDSRRVDIRSDIYSLGCTFYCCLAGAPPFSCSTAFEVIAQHLTAPAPPIRQLRNDVPPALVAVLERMMAKRPEYRFQTPGEVAEALAPFCKGISSKASLLPSQAQPAPARKRPAASTNYPSERPADLGGVLAWICLIVVVAATVLIGLVLVGSKEKNHDDNIEHHRLVLPNPAE